MEIIVYSRMVDNSVRAMQEAGIKFKGFYGQLMADQVVFTECELPEGMTVDTLPEWAKLKNA